MPNALEPFKLFIHQKGFLNKTYIEEKDIVKKINSSKKTGQQTPGSLTFIGPISIT